MNGEIQLQLRDKNGEELEILNFMDYDGTILVTITADNTANMIELCRGQVKVLAQFLYELTKIEED